MVLQQAGLKLPGYATGRLKDTWLHNRAGLKLPGYATGQAHALLRKSWQ